MSGDEDTEPDRKDVSGSNVREQSRAAAGAAAASTPLYHTKSMSRSGSIPFGNLHLTLDMASG